jgi:hypothetical protein
MNLFLGFLNFAAPLSRPSVFLSEHQFRAMVALRVCIRLPPLRRIRPMRGTHFCQIPSLSSLEDGFCFANRLNFPAVDADINP